MLQNMRVGITLSNISFYLWRNVQTIYLRATFIRERTFVEMYEIDDI